MLLLLLFALLLCINNIVCKRGRKNVFFILHLTLFIFPLTRFVLCSVLLFIHWQPTPQFFASFLLPYSSFPFHYLRLSTNECGKLWKIGSNIIFSTPCHDCHERRRKKRLWKKRTESEVGLNEVKWTMVWEYSRVEKKKYENGIITHKSGLVEKKGEKWYEGTRTFSLLLKPKRPNINSTAEKRILFVGECYYSHYSISLLLFMSTVRRRRRRGMKIVGSKLFTELCRAMEWDIVVVVVHFLFAFFPLTYPIPSLSSLVRAFALWVELNQHTVECAV